MSSTKQLILTTAFLIAAILSTGAVIQDYFIGEPWLARNIQETSAGPWEETMEVVSFIGQNYILIPLALLLFAWFLWKNHRAETLVVVAALISLAINPVLKIVVNRPRPPDDLVSVWGNFDGVGFPSGHAFSAVVLFGLLYYLVPLLVRWKAAAYLARGSLIMLILLIGISRVYLGAHWPSDVLGGVTYGTIMLTLLIGFHGWLSGEARRRYDAPIYG